MKDDDRIARVPEVAERPAPAQDLPVLGSWYWVKVNDESGEEDEVAEKEELYCVVHVGTNYAEVRRPTTDTGYSYERVHLREFNTRCRPAPDAHALIASYVEHYRRAIVYAARQITEMSGRLRLGVGANAETSALAVYQGGTMDAYKHDLVQARDAGIPELKKSMEENARPLKAWMQAEAMPLAAQEETCEEALKLVKKRIFGVELYAGLVEQAVRIKEGATATSAEPVHLFQRRHYMDEECLANYQAGGMRFEQLEDFEAWLLDQENLLRILPHPRSIVAFRVRREKVERDGSLESLVEILFGGDAKDMLTYLYVRNGDEVWRLSTGIDFGAKLFPDIERQVLTSGKVYAVRDFGDFKRLATEGEYLDLLRREKEFAEKLAKISPDDSRARWDLESQYANCSPYGRDSRNWVLWNQDSVYYDDITDHVASEMERHNRLVLVLQGLLDRSEVLRPHPPYKLWVAADFERALRLVYDDDRSLVSGPEPDFEAYRQAANVKLRKGSHTVGQEEIWMAKMAELENERNLSRYGYDRADRMRLSRYKPHGNPGPGLVAVAESVTKKNVCFAWDREKLRQANRWEVDPTDTVRSRLVVQRSEILCVDGYQAGDYKQFYADPRTRAKYLKWAPLLLRAEEWRAGKLPVTRPEVIRYR